MQFRLWLGVVTFIAGGVLWYVANRERSLVPPWLPRLAIGVASLGLGVLSLTQIQKGIGWSIASSCFALVAIGIIFSVLRERLKR